MAQSRWARKQNPSSKSNKPKSSSKRGKKAAQQEILEHLIDSAIQSRTEFVDSFRDSTDTLSPAEIDQFNKGMISSDVETDEDDIDEILYG